MNVITVLIDSLNRHALQAYGPSPIATPNLDAFAQRSLRFDNHFVGSLPCMPARREIFAGRKEMMWRPWGPLEPFDARLPVLLGTGGFDTAVITDHYHYWEEAANGYLQGFDSTTLIRGHELDNWKSLVPAADLPRWVRNIEAYRPGFGQRYYSNVKDFTSEEDYFPAKVFTAASDWLRTQRRERPFYLHVESFDVHEPFDVPEPYASMYGDGSQRNDFTLWPPYQDLDVLARFNRSASAEELAFIRAQYAGKLTMVDRWFGSLLATIDEQELWDDTVVIVTTDHGHDLGERGAFGKEWPHFDSHANIPAFIWHPALQAEQPPVTDLTSTVDLFATILDVASIESPHVHSTSLVPYLTGTNARARRAHVYGTFGQGVCCTDGRWSLFLSPSPENEPLFAYTSGIYRSLHVDTRKVPSGHGNFIPEVELPQWRIPVQARPRTAQCYLFDRVSDPAQEQNLWDERPEERDRMLNILAEELAREGMPDDQWTRLGLPRP